MKIPPIIIPESLGGKKRAEGPIALAQRTPAKFRYLSPADFKSFGNLFFAAKVIVEGAYSGMHRSPFQGASPEFVDYREYYPGDDIKTIDWKAFARTDRHFIKLFQRETDLNCYVLLDKSASMGYPGKQEQKLLGATVTKLEYASHLAAALAYLVIKQGDKAALSLFDDKLRFNSPAGGTFGHLYKLLNALERNTAGGKTSISAILRQAEPIFTRRGLLVVISDFLDEPDAIFKALNSFRHRGFEVILFQVLHELEYDLPQVDNALFVGLEDQESVQSRPADIAEEYRKQIDGFVRELATKAAARRIEHHFINTRTPFIEAIQRFLIKRSGR